MNTTYVVQPQAPLTTGAPVPSEPLTAQTPQSGRIAVVPEALEVGYPEGAQILDRAAHRKLGISGSEFLIRWDAGEYVNEEEECIAAQEVGMLIPFVRPVNAR